jgi:putative membrane protein (TIGR04086 family)
MRKIGNFVITLIVMMLVSLLCLCVVGILSYIYKWQADKALVGITITYILAGFTGGITQKILNKEKRKIKQKMLEGILTGLIFVGGLVIASVFIIQSPFMFSTRFFMILMLIIGSTCLGRIL